ncbi:hypothetical protein RCG24_20605 [Neobacillus sp. OS1-32]|uniref:hypothetical protein n=1 Tax=Neobacillus sp. OS1-32 TaxID=3070682 RepID=UPI0027E12017|nr:hypothetical protein [Neobacillus sp. OS1-32]WML30251.1 hypothetical protein RCG24_20605 [Neobacillus sp. OS1-32]
MEEKQTEVNEQHQEPDIETIQRELDETKATLQRKSIEYDFYRRASAKGISNIDKVMPFLDFSKVNDAEGVDTLVEMIDILAGVSGSKKNIQKPLGEPSNSGKIIPDKSPDTLLKEAGDKARKSGKLEDIAAFSALKQKLFGGNK